MSITRKMPADLQAYHDELEAYHLRFAAWLGLDPHEVAKLEETKRPVHAKYGVPQPDDLLVSWQSYGKAVEAEEHLGRHRIPWSVTQMDEDAPVFVNAVMLDWSEVDRLRAEVGQRPEFPAPAGGWPAHSPQP